MASSGSLLGAGGMTINISLGKVVAFLSGLAGVVSLVLMFTMLYLDSRLATERIEWYRDLGASTFEHREDSRHTNTRIDRLVDQKRAPHPSESPRA